MFRVDVEFDSEIPAITPAKIKIKLRLVIRNERQPDEFVSRRLEIPPAEPGILVRKAPAAMEFFVRHADNIKIKIMQRVAEAPLQLSMFIVRLIPIRRLWVIAVFEPPHRIEFLVKMDLRRAFPGCDLNRLPTRAPRRFLARR